MQKILIGLLVLIVLLAGASYLLPGTFQVERSIVMSAEPGVVYAQMSDLRTWPEWSAWSKERDPGVEFTYEGDPGVGQVWRWKGDKLGTGRLKLTHAVPAKGIAYVIAFDEGNPQGEGNIQMAPATGGLTVTWVQKGSLGKNPVLRWMGLMMDSVLGSDLEQSLSGLKQRCESAKPAADAAAPAADAAPQLPADPKDADGTADGGH